MTYKNLYLDHWKIDMDTGELLDIRLNDNTKNSGERIDPLGIQLLALLAENKGELVTKDALLSSLWPDTVVTEDALARVVSQVRKKLVDDSRSPKFIETLPKRGYRLIANSVKLSKEAPKVATKEPSLNSKKVLWYKYAFFLVIVLILPIYIFIKTPDAINPVELNQLIRQADDYYHNINRQDNEMALELYEQALSRDPNSIAAITGIANGLVQRAIRLPLEGDITAWEEMTLGKALADGRLDRETAISELSKAYDFSLKAIENAPQSARAHKAHGFVLSAQGKTEKALKSYERAISLDSQAWDVYINMGELYRISGKVTDAITHYKNALEAMNADIPGQTNRGRIWRAGLGSLIGDIYFEQNNHNEAEIWFRHVLTFAPFHDGATIGLSQVLNKTGRVSEAQRLCQAYTERVGEPLC